MHVADEREIAFIHAGIRLGLLTLEKIDDAIRIRNDMAAKGLEMSLEEVLVEKKFLTSDQLKLVTNTLTMKSGVALPGMELIDRKWASAYAMWFRARVEATKRPVLVKVLSKSAGSRMAIAERFIKACKEHAKLRHDNLMRIFDATRTNGIVYMACEEAEGTSLKDLILNSGPIAEEHLLRILKKLAEAVAVIHKAGLVHGNIKPENVILMPGSDPKLSDPGAARPVLVGEEWDDPDPFAANFHYLSPEQLEKKSPEARSDIYSLGAVAWFALTGGPIFAGTDPRRLVDQYLKDPIPNLKEIFHDVTPSTCDLIMKMLSRDPAQRHVDGSELCQALGVKPPDVEPAATRREPKVKPKEKTPPPSPGLDAPTPPPMRIPEMTPAPAPAPQAPAPPPPVTSKRPLILAAAGGAIVLIVAVILLWPSDKKKTPVPTPPPPKTVKDKPKPPPTVDPDKKAREDTAKALFDEAENEFKAINWARAFELYKRLQDEYAQTELFAQKQKEIGEHKDIAERAMNSGPKPPDKPQPDSEKIARDFAQAKQLMTAGAFKDALPMLEALLPKLPAADVENLQEVRARIDTCRREMIFDSELDKLREFAKAGSWSLVATLTKEMHIRFSGSLRYRQVKAEIESLQARAAAYPDYAAALKNIRAAFASSQWQVVVSSIEAFNLKYSGQFDYDEIKGELGDMEKTARRNLTMPMEDKAKTLFDEAEKHLDAKRWREAIDTFDALLKDCPDTDVVKSNRTMIQQHREVALSGQKKERDADGFKKYRAAKTLFDAKNWAEAQKILADLSANYAEALPDKIKDVQSMLEKCDKEIAAEKAALVDDGEGGVGGWQANGVTGGVEIGESGDAKFGGKSIKMAFKKHSEAAAAGTWPRLEHPIQPPSEDTVSISFWAKATQPFKIAIQLRLYSGDDEVVFEAQRPIGSTWQIYQVPLSEFKQVWQHPRRKATAKLTAFNIQKVGLATASPGADAEALIDQIKFELRK